MNSTQDALDALLAYSQLQQARARIKNLLARSHIDQSLALIVQPYGGSAHALLENIHRMIAAEEPQP